MDIPLDIPRVLIAAAVAAMTMLARPAAAEDYPVRPVRLVIPFPAGGSNDVVGRMVATYLGERIGRQLVIDNRGGAGAVIGTEAVAKSAPDGYTLLLISMAHAVNPWLHKLNYDPIKDFAAVAPLAQGTNVLAVHPSLPVHSVTELIALAKEKPGDLEYASAGIGTFQHLAGELFNLTAGVSMVHVPFRGGGPAMLSVVAGHTRVTFPSLTQTVPYIKSGALRALGVGSRERVAVLPDVPTVAEAGLPGYEALNWWGIVAPAGTPQGIIDRLNAEIAAVLKSAEAQKQLASEGATAVTMTPAAFGAFMASEMDKWGKVVKQSGIKAE